MPANARAARAWRLMFDFLVQSSPQRSRSLEKHGLTPNDSRALFTLEAGHERPIGALAEAWNCDPSTATWIIDRLERADLAERVPSTQDRRKKLVRLTAKGVATKRELMDDYYRPPAELEELTNRELDDLIRLLGKLNGK